MALWGIEKNVGLKSVAISTYQSLSGAGQLALDDRYETNPNRLKKLDFVIDNNLIPYIGKIDDKNFCVEEKKIIYETKKILHDKNLFVMSQTVRVPIDVCHGESIFFETKNACDIEILKQYIITTENVKYVWGGEEIPYLQSVSGNEDGLFQETKSFTKTEFAELIKDVVKDYDKNNYEINIIDYTGSGRVDNLQIGNEILKATELRKLIGIRSTNFRVEKADDGTITFYTIGYGHGVGMSQEGANQMAKSGYTCEEIIKHYYTGVEIQN